MIENMPDPTATPILLASMPVPENYSEPIKTTPAKFVLFKQTPFTGWVLRDYTTGMDYAFKTRSAATLAIEVKLTDPDLPLIGASSTLDLYGPDNHAETEYFA